MDFKGVVFDLDGVLTKTADLHAQAWKLTFDMFLKRHASAQQKPFVPFSIQTDYLGYVDGKPRLDGIQSFLASRNIKLPVGSERDPADKESVWSLAKKKNSLFLDRIEKQGVETYPSTVHWIEQLKKNEKKIGLISSSKNCRTIVDRVGLTHLFDVIIDGTDAQKEGIAGKPAPDIFLKAAERMEVNPSETIVVEDAISGVEAGKDGGFSLVIGLDRGNQARSLAQNGAQLVVSDLDQLNLETVSPPSAIDRLLEIKSRCAGKTIALFFDYDGTLTPIAPHPDEALLSQEMRALIDQLSRQVTLAIISGRDRPDVEKHVALDHIFYAGSHGFDIRGPDGKSFEVEEAKPSLEALKQAEKEVSQLIEPIEGAWVERKKYSVAIHYRQTPDSLIDQVEERVKQVSSQSSSLRLTSGKKIFEMQPSIDWNKGRALHWLLQLFKLDTKEVLPFYFGDDRTDEDAFLALKNCGIGIKIQEGEQPTYADYTLKNPKQLSHFLKAFFS